jgi:hypothetical protein
MELSRHLLQVVAVEENRVILVLETDLRQLC